MLQRMIPVTLLALAAPAVAVADGDRAVEFAQLTIHERLIIRVPRVRPAPVPRSAPAAIPRWREKKGPKCVTAADLGGAMISEPGSVDLIVTGGQRMRAKLDDDCGPLDYYSGFYLRPASDGEICAGRDVIRVRSGRSCEIKRFRKLVVPR